MATIRDVAARAGVSPTTVSIVMNGRAKEKRIPDATVERVTSAMRELGYSPNLTARRLRTNEARKPIIAFYWPLDYRTNMLGSFLSGIKESLAERGYECELVVQTYENDKFEKAAAPIVQNNYNGVLVGAASPSDLQYLETLDPPMPVVLINRESNRFSTVGTNSGNMGLQAASLIRQRGYTEVSIIQAERSYFATAKRTTAFIYACHQLNIQVRPEWIFKGPNTIAGGSVAAEAYCALHDRPRMLFCESDCMAQGALYTLRKYGLYCPQDLELLSIATQAPETMQYLIPSVSTISMPTPKIADTAIAVLTTAMQSGDTTPTHIELEPVICLRESFRLSGAAAGTR